MTCSADTEGLLRGPDLDPVRMIDYACSQVWVWRWEGRAPKGVDCGLVESRWLPYMDDMHWGQLRAWPQDVSSLQFDGALRLMGWSGRGQGGNEGAGPETCQCLQSPGRIQRSEELVCHLQYVTCRTQGNLPREATSALRASLSCCPHRGPGWKGPGDSGPGPWWRTQLGVSLVPLNLSPKPGLAVSLWNFL